MATRANDGVLSPPQRSVSPASPGWQKEKSCPLAKNTDQMPGVESDPPASPTAGVDPVQLRFGRVRSLRNVNEATL